jgi:nitrate reductase delta subunit
MEQDRANAASRVKAWTRDRFGDVTVLVTELESAVPGFPHLHTVVAFWSAEREHFHFKVFKPLAEVGETDIPPGWYRDALRVPLGLDCGCC